MDKNELATKSKNEVGPAFSTDEEHAAYAASRDAVIDARASVARSVNFAMVRAYWEIGRQANGIYEMHSKFGTSFLKKLANALTAEFGRGFTYANIYRMSQFNRAYPNFATVSQKLSWSHYTLLITVPDDDARAYYQREAEQGNLSVRALRRMVQTRAYERLLHAPGQPPAGSEQGGEQADIAPVQDMPQEQGAHPMDAILKDPYVLEFLNLGRTSDYQEAELEQLLIDKLESFLLELGRGFAFVGRQVRVSDDSNDYYVDLVFYNYLARCFVLVDLKTGKLDPRDVGQMDFYVRLFGETHTPPGDNPPVGLLLCATGDDTVVHFSALSDNPQLYAAQYLPYLPTEEELSDMIRKRVNEFEQRRLLRDA